MEEEYDSEQDFVLPPLPSTPQKTLLSFFQSKTNAKQQGGKNSLTKNKTTTCDEEIEITQSNEDNENSPFKPLKRKRRSKRSLKRILSDKQSDQEDSQLITKHENENGELEKELDGDNDVKDDTREDIKINDDDQNTQEELHHKCAAPLMFKMEMVKCDIPTPFPVVNHVKQVNDTLVECRLSEKWEALLTFDNTLNDVMNVESLPDSWRSLLNLESLKGSNSVTDDPPPVRKTLEEWLQQVESDNRDFPTRKIFRQYLACQKKVVMSDLQRIQFSKLAVQAIWQKDSEILSAEQQNVQVKEPVPEKLKEGKDIRKMFSNSKKKTKKIDEAIKTSVLSEADAKIKRCEEVDSTRTKKKEKILSKRSTRSYAETDTVARLQEDVEEEQEDVSRRKTRRKAKKAAAETVTNHATESEKVSISVSGLFGKALHKKDRRKRRHLTSAMKTKDGQLQTSHGCQDNEDICTSSQESTAPSKRQGKDIRTLFQQNISKNVPAANGQIILQQDSVDSCNKETSQQDDELQESKMNDDDVTVNKSDVTVNKSESMLNETSGKENDGMNMLEESGDANCMEGGDANGAEGGDMNGAEMNGGDHTVKRKKKKKKKFDFLKIKLLPTNGKILDESELEKKSVIPKTNIKSMFAKMQKGNSKDNLVNTDDQLSKGRNTPECSLTNHPETEDVQVNDPEIAIVRLNDTETVCVRLNDSVAIIEGKLERETEACIEESNIRDKTPDKQTNALKSKRKSNQDIRFFLGSPPETPAAKLSLSKTESDTKTGIIKDVEGNTVDALEGSVKEELLVLAQNAKEKASPVPMEAGAKMMCDVSIKADAQSRTTNDTAITTSVSMEIDETSKSNTSSEISLVQSDNQKTDSVEEDVKCSLKISRIVTPCKVEIQKVESPYLCSVITEDVSQLPKREDTSKHLQFLAATVKTEEDEEEDKNVERKRSRTKRKRNSSQSGSNKKLKSEDNESTNRQSLRNGEKPKCFQDVGEEKGSVNVSVETEEEHRFVSGASVNIAKTREIKNQSQPVSVHAVVEESKNIDSKNEKENVLKENVEAEGSLRRSSRSRKKINYNENVLAEDVAKTTKDPAVDLKKETRKKKDKAKTDPALITTADPESNQETATNISLEQSILCIEDGLNNNNNNKVISTCIMAPLTPKKVRPVIELVLNEETINSFLCWTEKYQPMKARYVIGEKDTVKELFNWLCSWKERHELIIKKMVARATKKPSKTYTDSDSESDESDEEELLSNTLLLSGPPGCGTTAAVYACAKQMDFKVLELNPNMYRTGKRVYDLVSEAVVSHQVRKGIKNKHGHAQTNGRDVSSFFKSDKVERKEENLKKEKKDMTQDAMSLVLFEQSDIVYEDYDRGFWQGVADLRMLAKRPIVLTANDDKILPLINTEESMPVEHISMTYPTTEQILPMMQIACLVEQVFVPRRLLRSIIEHCKNDVRQVMMQLQFWFDQGKEPLFTKFKNNKRLTCDVTTDDAGDNGRFLSQDVTSVASNNGGFSSQDGNLKKSNKKELSSCGVATSNKESFPSIHNGDIPVGCNLMDGSLIKDCEKSNNDQCMNSLRDSRIDADSLENVHDTTNKNHPLQTSGTIVEIADDAKKMDENARNNLDKIASDKTNENAGDKLMKKEASTNQTRKSVQLTKHEKSPPDGSAQCIIGIEMKEEQCVLDVEINGAQSNVDVGEMKKEALYIETTTMKHFPVYGEESLFDARKVIENAERRTSRCDCFTFLKPARKRLTEESQLILRVSDHADQLSEVDSYLMPGFNHLDKDMFQRSMFVDSLSEQFHSSVSKQYPSDELCCNVRGAIKSCYEYYSDQKLNVNLSRNNRNNFRSHYDIITGRMPTSKRFERTARSQEVVPCLENICKCEHIRKNTQQRRRQRRFLHYLDSIGMCLDESTMSHLRANSFNTA